LVDGSIAVIEYNGKVYAINDDSKEKNLVGLQWAKGSEGKRRFRQFGKADPRGNGQASRVL
jgi:hypothetical protein